MRRNRNLMKMIVTLVTPGCKLSNSNVYTSESKVVSTRMCDSKISPKTPSSSGHFTYSLPTNGNAMLDCHEALKY